jgi:hypothetical protein
MKQLSHKNINDEIIFDIFLEILIYNLTILTEKIKYSGHNNNSRENNNPKTRHE